MDYVSVKYICLSYEVVGDFMDVSRKMSEVKLVFIKSSFPPLWKRVGSVDVFQGKNSLRHESFCGVRVRDWQPGRRPASIDLPSPLPPLFLIAGFYLVDRGLRHRLPGFSSMGLLVILP